jgi:poly(hydroxyalkanoate) granule-associated protein
MACARHPPKENAMAGTKRSRRRSPGSAADPSRAARDSAQKIWLAGLGAFERARTEGPRVFEALVAQGRTMGARAVGAADQALHAMRQAGSRGPEWEKLQKAFEERLARSLKRLGVLTRDQVADLTRQVDEINRSLRAYAGKAATGAQTRGKKRRGAKPTAKRRGARPGAKRTTSRSRKARSSARRRAA